MDRARRTDHLAARITAFALVLALHAIVLHEWRTRSWSAREDTTSAPAMLLVVPPWQLRSRASRLDLTNDTSITARLPLVPEPSLRDDVSDAVAEVPAGTPIRWHEQAAISAAAIVEQAAARPRTRTFDSRDLPAPIHPATIQRDDFPWDPLHGQRFAKLPDGPFVLRLSDNCMVVILVMLIPTCKIGKLPARGDLFRHMGDLPLEEPLPENAVPPPPNP